MKHLLMIGAVIAALSTPAYAATTRCHGPNGRFVACPHTAAAVTTSVTRDANGRCRQAGKFVRCPAAH